MGGVAARAIRIAVHPTMTKETKRMYFFMSEPYDPTCSGRSASI